MEYELMLQWRQVASRLSGSPCGRSPSYKDIRDSDINGEVQMRIGVAWKRGVEATQTVPVGLRI